MADTECNPLKKYNKIEKIGEGSFSCVYRVSLASDTSKIYALKEYKNIDPDSDLDISVVFECFLLKGLKHPNIVQGIEIIDIKKKFRRYVYVVMELMPLDLKVLLASKSSLSPTLCRVYMKQIIAAVAFCHANGVIHRDIKPQNILIDPLSQTAKLCDFSISTRHIPNQYVYTLTVTSLNYRAPELLLGDDKYAYGIDLWSLGCVFGEMAGNGEILFHGTSEIEQLNVIFKHLGTPTEETWPNVSNLCYWSVYFKIYPRQERFSLSVLSGDNNGYDLLYKFIVCNPKQRISAKNALSHPYFTQ